MACKIFLHTNVYCVYDCVVGNLLVTRQYASLIFEIRVVILIFLGAHESSLDKVNLYYFFSYKKYC